MTLLPLVAAFYFCVSGGPHGLEPLMQSGAGLGLLLILITPILWALPAALMTAELSSAIPAEGGYYVWVKRAFGKPWAACCAWWMWIYSWVDVAIYPVLFASYFETLWGLSGFDTGPFENPWIKWATGLLVIVPLTWLNIRGAARVGKASILFGIVLILPFLVMIALGMPKTLANAGTLATPFIPEGEGIGNALNAGLFVVMWNYLGWDSLSTVAGEVENPQRNYPRAIFWALPIIVLSYLLPTLVGLAIVPDLSKWEEGLWPVIGQELGGTPLAVWIALTGMASAAGLFATTLLAASRVPFVMSEDRLLPPWLTRQHPKYGTPVAAILLSATMYTFFSYQSFENLAIVDVILYSAAIMLELFALLALRAKEPDLHRPYRIPGGWPVLTLLVAMPLAVVAFGVYNQFREESVNGVVWMSALALAVGPIAYAIARWNDRRASA